MIEHLVGTLSLVARDHIVVNVQGIGYRVEIPLSHLGDLPPEGSPLTIYTSHIVRENEALLFGFLSRLERSFFEQITTVSGIGPKTALALLAKFSLEQLVEAIKVENSALISKAPGIGRKTSERLILELRDKLPTVSQTPTSNISFDARQALMHLGYPEARAHKAVELALNQSTESPPLSELIRQALQCV